MASQAIAQPTQTTNVAPAALRGPISAPGTDAPVASSKLSGGAALEVDDWRSYLVQMEANNWDYFGKIDGQAFKATFWPRLQTPEFGQDPEFLLVCGSGLANWAYRQSTLSPQAKDQCYRESLPLLLKASEFGYWLAMTETSWMYRHGLGTRRDMPEANRWASNAVTACEVRFGPEHWNTARALTKWSEALSAEGDRKGAVPILERAVAITEKVLGPEHPDTATSLNNLATLYYRLGDYPKAEPLYERALSIREKVLGSEHRGTALSLNNLANLYRGMGDYAKAEPLLQRALKIHEKVLGPEHPDTAPSLNNLASLYEGLGDYAKAEPLYQRALKIHERVLGPEHRAHDKTLPGAEFALFFFAVYRCTSILG